MAFDLEDDRHTLRYELESTMTLCHKTDGGRAEQAPWPLICGAPIARTGSIVATGWKGGLDSEQKKMGLRGHIRSDDQPDPGSCDGFLLREGGTAPRECNCHSAITTCIELGMHRVR